MIKLTSRQQFNTFCILSNHGNDIKTFKTQVGTSSRRQGQERCPVVLLQVVSLL